MLPLSSIPVGVAPSRLAVLGGTGIGQTLEIAWLPGRTQPESVAAGEQSAAASSESSPAHVSSFEARWLREHCYSDSARRQRAASGDVAAEGGALPHVREWGPEVFAASPLPRVAWRSVLGADPGQIAEVEAARESAALRALELLHAFGFVLVDGVGGSVEATRELAQSVGLILPSIYGDIWDTGGELQLDYETDADHMVDTAYSNASLPLHTDGTYMVHPPGLQLFNCVAQSDVPGDRFGPEAGCTRLADGLAAAAALQKASPAAFDFFCGTPLPFIHRAGDAYVRSRAPVFRLDREAGQPAQIRYNETDRDVFDSLSAAEVEGFYKHARALEAALDASELRFKLAPGVALILDNQRVLHGRVGFEGRRNLIGCYLTADDWRSKLRVKRASRHATEGAG
jgi:trimethyllysine dioxygenase